MRADFRLGDWIIRPRRDCIERGDEVVLVHSRPMAVLEYLATAGGEVVTRDELFDNVWPGVIVTDDALTQCIVELRKAFGDSAHDAQIIKTIPKVGFCLIPPVVFLTEEQMAAHDKQDKAPVGATNTRGRLTAAASFVAVVIVLALVVYWYLDRPQEVVIVSPIPSIAVLPFTDMSEGGDQAYFADGLSEELLNSLAQVKGLKVIGRTSSFYFRDKNEKLPVIAETLGVSYLLEGSVRKDGNRLRITAQLLEASSGFHLWSETYDRELENIFAVQDEISAAITHALKKPLGIQLDVTPRMMATTNTEAHDAYLRGRYLLYQRGQDNIETAIREFKKAIALDPDYALAHAELAIAILAPWPHESGELPITEALARATPHAERAIALNPTLAEANLASARVMIVQGDSNKARAYYRRAIQINPNYSLAHRYLAQILYSDLGQYKDAIALQETAFRLDPLMRPMDWIIFINLIYRNRLAEAEQHMEQYVSDNPSRYAAWQGRLHSIDWQWANSLLGSLEAKRIDSEPWTPGYTSSRKLAVLGLDKEALALSGQPDRLTILFRLLGRPEEAVITAESSLAADPIYLRPLLGLALAAAGEYARARPYLEESWKKSNGLVTRGGWFSAEMAAALIAIRREAGAEAEVDELVAALRDDVRRLHEAGMTAPNSRLSADYQAGLADYLSGERERGLTLIAKAAEEGYFILPNEAYLQTLYDDPGFAPILEGQKARQARERKRFLDVVCNDARYTEIWQPAEGTCERFFSEAMD